MTSDSEPGRVPGRADDSGRPAGQARSEDPELDATLAELYEEQEETGHRVSERISVTVTAFLFLVLSVLYLVQAFGYDLGTLAAPGPGLFPLIIGFGLVLASVGLIWESLRLPRDTFVVWPYASYALRLVVVLVASIVYIVAMPVIGQFFAGALLCAAMLFAMRSRRWWLTILLSVVFSAAVQLLFGTVLGVPLPTGPLNF